MQTESASTRLTLRSLDVVGRLAPNLSGPEIRMSIGNLVKSRKTNFQPLIFTVNVGTIAGTDGKRPDINPREKRQRDDD